MTIGYDNVNDFIVIEADDRDPWVSWQAHLRRKSLGGVDVVAPIGTPIYAPAAGELRNIPDNGSGGHTATLYFPDEWRDQFMHLSRFVDQGWKNKGDLIGYSGDSAAPGQPHVHWHRIDPTGRRRNPWDYFTGSNTAGGDRDIIENETPVIEEKEDEMKTSGIYWKRSDGVYVNALITPGSGFWTEWTGATGNYNNPIAESFETGSFALVSESHANALKASASAVRARKE